MKEAVEIRRKLAGRYPRVFVPELVQSLLNLKDIMDKLGKLEEVRKVTDELEKLLGRKIEPSYMPS